MNLPIQRIGAAALVAAAAFIAVPQPAFAASHRACAVAKHGTTRGVDTVGSATAKVVPDGLRLTTAKGQNADKVAWQAPVRQVLASSITELSYETIKLDQPGTGVNDAALPSYHLHVRTPQGPGTLVYEPYQRKTANENPPRDLRIEWNVLDGLLWTPSTTIAGLPKTAGGPSTKSLAQIVKDNPRMTVTGIGFGLGTYNPGTIAVLDEQRFATKTSCTEHQWSTGFANGPWWIDWLRRS